MKAYTDIKQSKKLAEILPIESADMCWVTDEIEPLWGVVKSEPDDDFDVIPCWSLAALLDLLKQVKEIKYQRVTILVGRYAGGHWYVELLRVQDEKSVLFEHSKDLVDACVEMVLKLHELNLL